MIDDGRWMVCSQVRLVCCVGLRLLVVGMLRRGCGCLARPFFVTVECVLSILVRVTKCSEALGVQRFDSIRVLKMGAESDAFVNEYSVQNASSIHDGDGYGRGRKRGR